MDKSWEKGIPVRRYSSGFLLFGFFGFAFFLLQQQPNATIYISNLFLTKNIITFFHMQLRKDPDSNVWKKTYHQ